MAEPGPILLAPVLRRDTTEWMVEKATELGASAILLTTSTRSAVTRTNPDRLAAIAIEAAEQCGRLTVPRVDPPQALERRLADWPEGLGLVVCDETGASPSLVSVLAKAACAAAPPAVLVGPEGGFEPRELDRLRNLPFSLPASLGPRTLRAETAALASLALVQALAGDWRGPQALRLSVPS
ncbi:MAG: RsmE family RNA methyltransferase [Acetobacteraceae bacterium]|nr:RsmE family RNA methyltransferase [Acetobacteraceae bacterium]